jgi:hypothetical protein
VLASDAGEIPLEIVSLALDAVSDYNDGWTKQDAKKVLIAIRDYIDSLFSVEERIS